MISDERAEKALRYLVETDEEAARAKADLVAAEEKRKTVRAVEFLRNSGTVAEREALSMASEGYESAVTAIEEKTYTYEALRLKRASEALVIEMWRSLNANKRVGNV